jgi:hypothetical protein
LYWNRLVWVNTCAPFRATDPEGGYAPGLDYTSSTVIPYTAPRKPSRLTGEAIRACHLLYSAECVEGDFSEVGCRMPHSPARWPPYGLPESSRLPKVDHYILDARIKMRSGGCAASSQNTDTDTAVGVVRRFDPGSVTRGTACLTWVCVCKAI